MHTFFFTTRYDFPQTIFWRPPRKLMHYKYDFQILQIKHNTICQFQILKRIAISKDKNKIWINFHFFRAKFGIHALSKLAVRTRLNFWRVLKYKCEHLIAVLSKQLLQVIAVHLCRRRTPRSSTRQGRRRKKLSWLRTLPPLWPTHPFHFFTYSYHYKRSIILLLNALHWKATADRFLFLHVGGIDYAIFTPVQLAFVRHYFYFK